MTNAAQGEPAQTFKSLLKGYRVRAGLTQEELAAGAGISVRAISDMERGIAKSPQRRTIESLAVPLSLTDAELTDLQKVAKRSRTQPMAAPPSAPTGLYHPPLIGQLPLDVDDLAGREGDLDTLRVLAADLTKGNRRSGRVAVLSGPPGTGKTTLAVRAAYDLAAHFPDGRLFLQLRGMSPEPSNPADVLHLILRSLGIDAVRIPSELEDRMSLCRSLLQKRATLLVFDDAADEAQVRPLVVGGPRCLTLITSRHMLVGLEGADRLNLDVLDRDDSVALLTTILGEGRVSRERAAAIELAEMCGRLPLALRIAGNRLASRPTWPLARLVDQLRDQNRRLTTLTAGDLNVRSVFELSYRQLSLNAAAMFRRLSLVPAADFSVEAAMALLNVADEDDASIFLEELADASLLQTSPQNGRYQFHDLLRMFAKERLTCEEAEKDILAAERRLEYWLVRTATNAGRYFSPSNDTSPPPAATSSFDDHTSAGRWLEVELTSWLAAAKRLAARDEHQLVLDLAESMHWYSEIGGTASTWNDIFELALDSALKIGSKRDEAVHRNYLAWVLGTLSGRADDSIRMSQQALDAAIAAGDLREQGWARIYLANARMRDGDVSASPGLFDEAVQSFVEADYPVGLYVARTMRAVSNYESGRFEDAALEFEACVRHFKRLHEGRHSPVDDTSYAYLLLRSAQNLTALNSCDEALAQYEKALDLFYEHGAILGQARALQAIGKLMRQQGDHKSAYSRLAEGLTLFERIGLAQAQVDTLSDMAALSDELGDPASARSDRERALSLCDRLGRSAGSKLREKLTEQLNAS
ncbi:NB-ARC domain-containing protein [Amycolatopsis japonica]|uniref:ATP-binding protein n=1 Tax=Amycolatopsis japonica TaxID=208439 RepID=UPI00331BC820